MSNALIAWTRRSVAALVALAAVAAPSFGSAESTDALVKDLVAPSTATTYDAKLGPTVTAPITGGTMSMPYSYIFPLPAGPIGDPKKTYTFCFSQALTGSTWAVAQQESVRIEAARHPNVKVLYYNTNNDPLKQVADLDTCMAQKVDAVLVWPHSVAPLTPEIEKMKKAGFIVVGMERTVQTHDYDTWIYLDHVKAMNDVADAVCKKLNGKGTVAETDGAIGSSPQILRRAGFTSAIKAKCPGVTVEFTAPTDYSRGQGYKVALDFLQSRRDQKIDAWFTQYTEIGFGVNQALKDYKRTDIPQFSVVDGKNSVEGVQKGTFYAITPLSPLHGDVALRAAVYHVLKKPVPKDVLLIQPALITPANAAQALRTTWPG